MMKEKKNSIKKGKKTVHIFFTDNLELITVFHSV